MKANMETIFNETFDSMNSPLHDLIVCINYGNVSKIFKVHAFILASSSLDLAALIKQSKKEQILTNNSAPMSMELNDVRPELFEQCLKYAYTHTCDLIKVGPCNFKITSGLQKQNTVADSTGLESYVKDMTMLENSEVDENSSAYNAHQNNKRKKKRQTQLEQKLKEREKQRSKEEENAANPLILLNDLAKQLGMYGLCKQLCNFKFLGDSIVDTRPQYWRKNNSAVKNSFTRINSPELHDVVIVSEDDIEFSAHRCILSARLEYFNSMFNLGWIETGKNKMLNLPVQSKVLGVLLDYIYKDEAPYLNKSDDVEFVCQVLAVADQLLGKNLWVSPRI